MDVSQLPEDVREKLAELELELSEGEKIFIDIQSTDDTQINFTYFHHKGDITQKGYEKKRSRLLAPFINSTTSTNNNNGGVAGKFKFFSFLNKS